MLTTHMPISVSETNEVPGAAAGRYQRCKRGGPKAEKQTENHGEVRYRASAVYIYVGWSQHAVQWSESLTFLDVLLSSSECYKHRATWVQPQFLVQMEMSLLLSWRFGNLLHQCWCVFIGPDLSKLITTSSHPWHLWAVICSLNNFHP